MQREDLQTALGKLLSQGLKPGAFDIADEV